MGWGVLSQVSSLGSLQSHLPGYIGDYEKLTKAGAEVIACVSINDAFVMAAWGTANGSSGKVSLRQVPASRTSALCDVPSRSAGQLSKSEGQVTDWLLIRFAASCRRVHCCDISNMQFAPSLVLYRVCITQQVPYG